MNEKGRPDMGEITAGDLVDIREDIVTLRKDLERPLLSLLAAFGIGFIGGNLLRR